MEECIEIAWKNNLQIKQAQLDVDAGENELQNSKANRLPNLNGFASHNYNWGQRIDPFTNQFANTRVQSNSFGLNSSITLFNGFQNEQNIKAQQASLQTIIYDVESQKNQVALAVSSAYLSVLLAEELLSVADVQVNITQQQLSRVEKLVDAGASNIGVQYDLEAQLASDVANQTQRKNDYQLSLLQVKQLLMLPADETLSLEKSTEGFDEETVLVSVPSVYAQAEQNMPEIKRAQMSIQQWENQIKVSKSGYYPSLTLSGSIGTGYSGLRTEPTSITPGSPVQIGATESGEFVFAPTFDTEVQRVAFGTQLSDNFNQFVGLSLNVPIFNRGGVYTSVQRSRINQERAEIQLDAEKRDLRQRIESAHADAVAAKQTVVANEKAVEASRRAFEFSEIRFENGALNVIDFNNAKNNLQAAEARLSRAKFDYLFKTMVLEFYLGQPLSMKN
ncbi:MAG: TolC family protein [Salibacteraceae bacterium]